MAKKHLLNWTLGYSDAKDKAPGFYVPAVVPGAVQLDIARYEKYPDNNYADNFKLFRWMEDMYYVCKSEFQMLDLSEDKQLWFVSKGIDYEFEVWFNGRMLHYQEGMFSHVELNLTPYLHKNNILEVRIMPVPKRKGYPDDRSQASNVTKPAVSYGWDWHPRLVPLGIWDETYLEERSESHISDVYVNYVLTDDFLQANMALQAHISSQTECRYEWQLIDAGKKEVARLEGYVTGTLDKHTSVSNPHLWWTHDHGTPYLYTSIFNLLDKSGNLLDSNEQRIGFRQVHLVMNEGAWDEPKEFPKTRSVPPAQIELNGRKIFAKGTNWVNPEIFPGTITAGRYKELLDIAVSTHFNIIRTWGGSIINKDSFFDFCDEMGLLVWQEFPLACNKYPDESHYLSVLKQEAISIVKRLRKHACIALWCGGNELFNAWSRMTDQSLALRMLNSICLEHNPQVPFIPTSPLFGMAHGNYVFKWAGQDVFQFMYKSHNTAYTEFGMPGISPRVVLEKFIPKEDLFPPKEGTAWETHHALKSWDVGESTWLCQHILTEYMGEARSLNELIEQSQLMQGEGYKAIYEEARRKKPYCSMALNWCFNEPWPAAANNSLVVYPAIPKPAVEDVRNSCRPICVSARIPKFSWEEGEYFFADIWLLNDAFEQVKAQRVHVKLKAGNEEITILEWNSSVAPENTNVEGPTARFKLPAWDVDRVKLLIEVPVNPEYNSEYTVMYHKKKKVKETTAVMNL